MPADPFSPSPAPGAPPGVADVVDPTVLGALAARLGERATGFLATLLETWEQETTSRLAELDRAVTEGKALGVARVAHSMRGSSAAMGAVRLSAACGEVELAARGGGPLDLGAARDLLAAEVALALRALHALHRPA